MNKSARFWNKVATKYNSNLTKTESKILKRAKPFLSIGHCALDVGCGQGIITNHLSRLVASVDGIDTSSGMIEVAIKEASKHSIKNVAYKQASIFDDEYNNKQYDVIFAFNVLHYIEKVPSFSKRINELLKPNGYFISSTACLNESKSFLRFVMGLSSKIGLIPKTVFYKKNELENLINKGNFETAMTDKISDLPEYFIVAKK